MRACPIDVGEFDANISYTDKDETRPMTQTENSSSPIFNNRAGGLVRDILAAVVAVAAAALVFVLAMMLTAAFLFVFGAALLVAGTYWLWRKVKRPAARREYGEDGMEILVATRGPKGWTVDGMGSPKS